MNIENQIESLQTGESLIVSGKRLTNKHGQAAVHIKLAEKIETANSDNAEEGINLTQLLNKSTEGFNQRGARRAMGTYSLKDMKAMLPNFPFDKLPENGEEVDLGIKNPGLTVNGTEVRMRILIKETTVPTAWQKERLEAGELARVAKLNPTSGNFITKDGLPVFSNTVITAMPVGKDPKHTLITDTVETPEESVVMPSNVDELAVEG